METSTTSRHKLKADGAVLDTVAWLKSHGYASDVRHQSPGSNKPVLAIKRDQEPNDEPQLVCVGDTLVYDGHGVKVEAAR